jgi:hypothetical protein
MKRFSYTANSPIADLLDFSKFRKNFRELDISGFGLDPVSTRPCGAADACVW